MNKCYVCDVELNSDNPKMLASKPDGSWIDHPVCDKCYQRIWKSIEAIDGHN